MGRLIFYSAHACVADVNQALLSSVRELVNFENDAIVFVCGKLHRK